MIFNDSELTYGKLKLLAEMRIGEAKVLFAKGRYSGAYYLAGYSIECALKAVYCKSVRRNSFPPSPKVVQDLYSHQLDKLLEKSGLKADFDIISASDPLITASWAVVKDWSEKARYSKIKKSEASSLINAIEGSNGILNWIKTKW